MLETLFSQVEQVFPSSISEVNQNTWDEHIPMFCQEIYALGEDVFKMADKTLYRRLFLESKNEVITSHRPMISLCKTRLRPKSAYYKKFGLPIPSPENPTGPHATGVELSLSLYRGYPSNGAVSTPWLSIDFSIWGHRERLAFLELLNDHRRYIEKVISSENFEFNTACWFDEVQKYKGNYVFKKLELYAQCEEDQENSFTISKIFTKNPEINEFLPAVLKLLKIYDASLGYCLHKKDKDRVFKHTVSENFI